MELNDLRRIAEAATPGPWEKHDLPVTVANSNFTIHALNAVGVTTWTTALPPEIASTLKPEDAEFVATFDPATVLALLSRLEQAEQAADELLTERDYWEKKLTDLVYALATVEEVGEWSSMNDISDNLIEHIGGKIQKLEKATERVRELLSYYKVDSPLARVAIRALDGDGRG